VEGRQIVAKAHSFRRALYAHLTDPADLRSFGRLAPTIRRAAASAEFVLGDDGLAQWAIPSGIGLELPLVTVAWEAGNLLTSTDRLRVGRCPGNDCGWLFLDRSGRRKWCDMASCGNRAKVRAYNKRAKR
jgi:predicted RNA-binding Zn ribbon-like protein